MKHLELSALDAPFTNISCPIEFLLFLERPVAGAKLRAALQGLAEEYWPAFALQHPGFLERRSFVEDEHFQEHQALDEDFDAQIAPADLYMQFRDVSPELGRSLFFLSCIQYRNGTVLIAKLDHLAGDGYSFFYMLAALAAKSRREHGISGFELPAPRLERTIERSFRFPGPGSATYREPISRDVSFEYVDVSQAEVQRVCEQASELSQLRVSPGDVLTAKVLVSLLRRQPELFEDGICLTVPIDVRRILEELGPTFFGNGIVLYRSYLNADQVLSAPEHVLAAQLRRAAPRLDRAAVLSHIATVDRIMAQGYRPLTYAPERGCLITNLLRMSWEVMDFGTGQPGLFHVLTVGPNTASLLPAGSDFRLRILHPSAPVTSTHALAVARSGAELSASHPT